MKQSIRPLVVLLLWLAATWSATSCGSDAGSAKDRPTGLMCELMATLDRADVCDPRPKFSWIVPRDMQQAYRILVASDPSLLVEGKADLWDSGKVESSQSAAVPYAGKALESNQSYCWQVCLWIADGKQTAWSDPERFKTGRLGRCAELLRGTTSRYPLTETEVAPTRVVKKGPGHFFIDFGRAAFGTIRFTARHRTGEGRLTIQLGEKACPDDTVDRDPGATIRYRAIPLKLTVGEHTYRLVIPSIPSASPLDTVPLPPNAPEVMPFRYCEIEGLSEDLTADDVRQICSHYPFDDSASAFTSSDKTLNDVWDLCKYSMKATSFCGVYVDGDREREPYEADAYINQLGHYCADREFTLARYTHEYLMTHPTWPTEWSMHSVLIAWADYLYTGDADSLVEFYDDLKPKTLSMLERDDGLISTIEPPSPDSVPKTVHSGALRDLVDWPEEERDGYELRPVNTVVNAFHYRSLMLMARIAEALQKPEDAAKFRDQANRVDESINAKLFDSQTGLYLDGEGSRHSSLHANMFPLAFGLVPPERIEKVANYVAGRGMACSVYAAQYLLEGLYESGQADAALNLMTAKTERSWAHMIYDVGSTITLEAWDNKFKPNQDWNHAWGAAPANIIPRKLMGIEPLEPGFRKVLIRPQPGSLEQAAMTLPTIRGPIRVSFVQSAGRFMLEVTLPGNTTADVQLPCAGGKNPTVLVDGVARECAVGNMFIAIGEIGPGPHRVEMTR